MTKILTAIALIFLAASAPAQTATSALNITIKIPEVLHVVSNRVTPTDTGASQYVVVRGNLRRGYCVRPIIGGVMVQSVCTTTIGESVFMFNHKFTTQYAPDIGVEIAPQ